MIPLEGVRFDAFAPLDGHVFLSVIGDVLIELRLHDVRKLGHKRTDAARDPFSLTFRGWHGLRLPQGTCGFSCESLGEIEFFITQVGDGARGSEFEAIFT
ncbi:MAG: hypothetical protein V4689_11225 [Verrucomicrobiota bacterium]